MDGVVVIIVMEVMVIISRMSEMNIVGNSKEVEVFTNTPLLKREVIVNPIMVVDVGKVIIDWLRHLIMVLSVHEKEVLRGIVPNKASMGGMDRSFEVVKEEGADDYLHEGVGGDSNEVINWGNIVTVEDFFFLRESFLVIDDDGSKLLEELL